VAVLENVFNPQPGVIPPVFAGREKQFKVFQALISELNDQSPKPSLTVLYAPRGYGKTSLLRYVREHTREFCKQVGADDTHTVLLTPAKLQVEKLYQNITEEQIQQQRSVTTDAGGNFKATGKIPMSGIEIGGEGGGGVSRTKVSNGAHNDYQQILKRVGEKQPTLLCIDEAHTIELPVLRAFLQSAQQSIGNKVPVSIVLAGTPGLPKSIDQCKASFASRYELATLNRLSKESSRQAVEGPFKEIGVKLPEELINVVLDASEGYPHFLQVYGSSIWDNCLKGSEFDGSRENLRRSREHFSKRKNQMFKSRYEEMEREEILDSAYEVAMKFRGAESLTRKKMRDHLIQCGSKTASEDIDRLHDLGYIWQSQPHELEFEKGIPSLMSYVIENMEKE